MKIYLASSRRNAHFKPTLLALREAGHEVYDFTDPPFAGGTDAPDVWVNDYQGTVWGRGTEAAEHFAKDLAAMRWADAIVLVLPAGKSAHLELGWAAGAGKLAICHLPQLHPSILPEPELMYRLGTSYTVGMPDLLRELRVLQEFSGRFV